MMKPTILCILMCVVFCSCDLYQQDEYEEHYVVEAYLYAGRKLPDVRLSTTFRAHEKYDFSRSSTVRNANIQIRLIKDDHSTEKVFDYIIKDGRYNTEAPHTIIPGRTYKLIINFPNSDDTITASTTIPFSTQIVGETPDSIVYRSEQKYKFKVSKNSRETHEAYYTFNTYGQNLDEENLTPVFLDLYIDGGYDSYHLKQFAIHSWGLVNENSFINNNDGSLTIPYPWDEFPYFGDNMIIVNKLDDNLYDFLRSQRIQHDETSLSPGEMQNVIHNINGALGVFGSIASDTTSVYLKKPE